MEVSVEVYVRVRPLSDREPKSSWKISSHDLQNIDDQARCFDFGEDHVLQPEIDTPTVYERVGRPIVQRALEGFHGYIFAYGQTSSGKTHTMLGTPERPGIIPLALRDVFDAMATKDFVIKVSYLEIYQEQIKDLLDVGKGNLDVFLDEKRVPMMFIGRFAGQGADRVRVEATAEMVRSPEEVMALIKRGESHRHYGATKMNLGSSRSHTIFRMEISSREPARKVLRVSELFLIDLAGSENVKKSGASGMQADEAGRINQSLLALEKVVRTLDEQSRGSPGPMLMSTRDSKLTRFLKPALGGNSRTAIICAVTPASQHVTETISTLDFASRAKNIRNKVKVNEVLQEKDMQMLLRYKEEVEEIRMQLLSAEQKEKSLQQQKVQMEKQQQQILSQLQDQEAKAALYENKVSELSEELSAKGQALQAQVQEQMNIRADLTSKISMLEKMISPETEKRREAEEARQRAEAILQQQQQRLQAHESQQSELRTMLNNYEQKQQDLEQQVQDYRHQCTIYEEAMGTLKEQLESEQEELLKRVIVHEQAAENLNYTIQERDAQLAQLQSKLSHAETQLADVTEALQHNTEQVTQLRAALITATEQLEETQVQLEHMTSARDAAQQQVREQQVQISALHKANVTMERTNADLAHTRGRLDEELAHARQEHGIQLSELTERMQQMTQARDRMQQDMTATITELQAAVTTQTDLSSQLQSQLNHAQRQKQDVERTLAAALADSKQHSVEHQSAVGQLHTELQQRTETIAKLNTALQESESNAAKLRQQLHSAEQRSAESLDGWTKRLQAADTKVASLDAVVRSHETDLAAARSKCEQLQASIDAVKVAEAENARKTAALQERLAQLEAASAIMEQSRTVDEQQLQAGARRCAELERSCADLQQQHDHDADKLRTLQVRTDEQATELEQVTVQRDDMVKRLSAAETSVRSLQAERDTLANAQAELQSQLQGALSAREQTTQELQRVQQALAAQKSQAAAVETDMSAAERTIQELKQNLATEHESKLQLEKQLSALRTDSQQTLSAKEEERSALEARAVAAENALQEMQARLSQLQTESASWARREQELKRDADTQNAVIETLRASVKTFEEKREDLEAKVARFQGMPDAGEERRLRQQAESELQIMRSHVLQVQSEQEQAMEGLRRRIAVLDTTCKGLEHDNAVVTKDYKELKEKYDQMKSARAGALAQVANMRASVQSSDDELRQALRMADSTESKLADIAKILEAVDKVADSDKQQAQQVELLERAMTDLSTQASQKQSELRNMEQSQQQLRAKLQHIYAKRLEARPVQASVTGTAPPPPSTAPPATKPAAATLRRTESASAVEASTAARRPSGPSSQQTQQKVITRGRTSELAPAAPPVIAAPAPVTSAKLAAPIAGAVRQPMAAFPVPSAAYRTPLTPLPAAGTADRPDSTNGTEPSIVSYPRGAGIRVDNDVQKMDMTRNDTDQLFREQQRRSSMPAALPRSSSRERHQRKTMQELEEYKRRQAMAASSPSAPAPSSLQS
eukprot:TRINITY_DN3202_c0_g2_i1.p1 TRINITY_DN3202_c0_g2~~TRINITY_DN3202_c0_g2_i1.p1  ORF type:complete len:1514 (-),score=501.34 TRINITY_DN3202_c0_g2_i1:91-4632(-)